MPESRNRSRICRASAAVGLPTWASSGGRLGAAARTTALKTQKTKKTRQRVAGLIFPKRAIRQDYFAPAGVAAGSVKPGAGVAAAFVADGTTAGAAIAGRALPAATSECFRS